MECWHARHPKVGLVEVFTGTFQELKGIDPDFPADPSAEKDSAASKADKPTSQLEGKVDCYLGNHPYLVRVNGQVIARRKTLEAVKISLEKADPKDSNDSKNAHSATDPTATHSEQKLLKTGEKDKEGFHREIALVKPYLKMETGLLNSWIRELVIHTSGLPMEMDAPPGSRGAKRLKAMEESPFKRWFYPLIAGFGQAGWALFILIGMPLIGKLLEPIFRWLAQFIPDFDINIPWPEVNLPSIPWPDINLPQIPWPDWQLPQWDMPWIVEMALEYPKVWVPIVLGLAIGTSTVQRGKKSREAKLRTERENLARLFAARMEQLEEREVASEKEKE